MVVEACQPWLVVEAPQPGLVEASQELVVAQAEGKVAHEHIVGHLWVVALPQAPQVVSEHRGPSTTSLVMSCRTFPIDIWRLPFLLPLCRGSCSFPFGIHGCLSQNLLGPYKVATQHILAMAVQPNQTRKGCPAQCHQKGLSSPLQITAEKKGYPAQAPALKRAVQPTGKALLTKKERLPL